MPEWLIQVIIQYPIVVIVGLIAWYAHREIKRTNADARTHERQKHADVVEAMRRAAEKLTAAQAAEIKRLNEEFRDELRKLTKVVTELNRRLNS